jgi:hypothetical protein
MVASLWKGIFPKEDHYLMLNDKLEDIKDIAYSLKISKTLKRICPPVPKHIQSETLANEESFGLNEGT